MPIKSILSLFSLITQLVVFQCLTISFLFMMSNSVWAQSNTGPQHSNAPLNVTDGSSSCYPYSLAVSSGTLTCSNGIATVTTGSGGSGSGNVGIGTTGRIPVYIGTTTIGSPYNNVMDSNGNIGIGTNVPSAKLSIGTGNLFTVSSVGNVNFSTSLFGNTGASVLMGNASTSLLAQTLITGGGGDESNLVFRSCSSLSPVDCNIKFFGSNSLMEFARFIDSGNLGIASTAPGATLDVVGSIRATSIGVGTYNVCNVSGNCGGGGSGSGTVNTGTGGRFAYYPATGTTVDDQTGLTSDGTNVGIGTLSPGVAFDMNDTMRLPTSSAKIYFGSDIAAAPALAATAAGNMQVQFSGGSNITFTSGGNVGIGSDAPGAKLDIINGNTRLVGTARLLLGNGGTDNYIRASSATATPDIELTTAGATTSFTNAGNVGINTSAPGQRLDVSGGIRVRGANPLVIGDSNANYLAASATGSGSDMTFNTNSLERFRVTTGGNIGIGTTTPQTKLAITSGNVGIGTWTAFGRLSVGGASSGFATTVGGNGISFSGPGVIGLSAANTQASSSSAGAFVGLYSDDGAAMAAGDRLGGFLFGASSSATSVRNTILVGGFAENAWTDASDYGSYVRFETTAPGGTTRSEKMRILGAGNVGLGTTTPQAQLVVYPGNVGIGTWTAAAALDTTGFRLSTNPSAGYVLTSTSVGIGTWMPSSGGGGGTTDDYLSTLVNAEVAVTTTATLTISKQHLISGTSADYTVTLPAASGNTGKFLSLRINPTATKVFTVDGNASETIDGALTRIMWAGESATLYCDGSNWFKIAGKTIPMYATMYKATNSTQPTTDTSTKVLVDTILVDNTGFMADTTNKRINIVRPGNYIFDSAVFVDPTGITLQRIIVDQFKNGSRLFFNDGPQWTANAYAIGQTPLSLWPLAASDYVELYGVLSYSAGAPVFKGGNGFSHLGIIEVPSW